MKLSLHFFELILPKQQFSERKEICTDEQLSELLISIGATALVESIVWFQTPSPGELYSNFPQNFYLQTELLLLRNCLSGRHRMKRSLKFEVLCPGLLSSRHDSKTIRSSYSSPNHNILHEVLQFLVSFDIKSPIFDCWHSLPHCVPYSATCEIYSQLWNLQCCDLEVPAIIVHCWHTSNIYEPRWDIGDPFFIARVL